MERKLEEKARFIANKTLKEALHGLTLEELRISQEVLRKIFTNTKELKSGIIQTCHPQQEA